MNTAYIHKVCDVARGLVAEQNSMNPLPYRDYRDRIEDANGNEVFRREVADYMNSMQSLVPVLVGCLDAALSRIAALEVAAARRIEVARD